MLNILLLGTLYILGTDQEIKNNFTNICDINYCLFQLITVIGGQYKLVNRSKSGSITQFWCFGQLLPFLVITLSISCFHWNSLWSHQKTIGHKLQKFFLWVMRPLNSRSNPHPSSPISWDNSGLYGMAVVFLILNKSTPLD